MRWLTDRSSWREEVNSFRFWFIRTPAKLVTTGGGFFLDLPQGYFWKDRWLAIEEGIQGLQFAWLIARKFIIFRNHCKTKVLVCLFFYIPAFVKQTQSKRTSQFFDFALIGKK